MRALSIALLCLLPPWGAFAGAAYLETEQAPSLAGHVVSTRTFVDRKTNHMYRIQYVYTDELGIEHEGTRDLIDSAAFKRGLTTDDAPISVKVVMGEELLGGEFSVHAMGALALMAACALVAGALALQDLSERRRAALALHGKLTRGELDSVSKRRIRGSDSLVVGYRFQTETALQTAMERIYPIFRTDLLLALALDRLPAPGERVWIAYEPLAPNNSTIFSFTEDESFEVPSTPVAPLPPALAMKPRAVPASAPRLSTEFSMLVVTVFAALGLGIFAVNLFGGFAVASLGLAFFAPLYAAEVLQKRGLLRSGTPLATRVNHVAWISKKHLSISFEGETPQGALRGKERLHRTRVEEMGVNIAAGDTMFLVYRPERPWERAVWGFQTQSNRG